MPGASLYHKAVKRPSGGDLTEPKYETTGTFGYYRFDALESGQTYVVTVQAKRFTFNQPALLIGLDQDIADVDFTANQ